MATVTPSSNPRTPNPADNVKTTPSTTAHPYPMDVLNGGDKLARRWHTPVYLISFLDDARERNVMRTVGSAYQFRHSRLQDRLADADSDSGNDSNTTSRLPRLTISERPIMKPKS